MLDVEPPALGDQVGFTLALVRGAGHGRADLALAVHFDDDAVLGQLLLHEDDLLDALHNKVTAGVDRALIHLDDGLVALAGEHAVRRPQHYGHAADAHVLAAHDLLAAHILHVHELCWGNPSVALAGRVSMLRWPGHRGRR